MIDRRRADRDHHGEGRGSERARHEGEQQQDRGQGHAPLPGEIFGKAPGGAGHEQAADRRRAVAVDVRADIMADPCDRDEQDRCRDRDEDVVESGQQPEMLLVHRRGMLPGRDEVAEIRGLRRASARRPPPPIRDRSRYTWAVPPVRMGLPSTGVLVMQYSRALCDGAHLALPLKAGPLHLPIGSREGAKKKEGAKRKKGFAQRRGGAEMLQPHAPREAPKPLLLRDSASPRE